MRRSTSDTSFITADDTTEVVGVALGYDFCSEHEQGIKPLMQMFGLDLDAPGLDRYRVTQVPKNLKWITGKDRDGNPYQGFGLSGRSGDVSTSYALEELRYWEKQQLSATWRDDGFAIIAWTDEGAEKLKTIFEALQAKQATLTKGSAHPGNPFRGSGPCFLRTDIHPDMWEDLDWKLRQEQAAYKQWCDEWALESEGIYTALITMGSKLGGGWTRFPWIFLPLMKPNGTWTYMPKASTREDGIKRVWLNPSHQDLFRFGWYTSEELRQWAIGDGPIWPLCVALPPKEHPFWDSVLNSIPSPNQSRPPGLYRFDSFHANLATKVDWMDIKGIGPTMAAKIVAERRTSGPFVDADDVQNRVRGIGPKLHRRIRYQTYYCPVEWHSFPFERSLDDKVYRPYLDGEGFWTHAMKVWGFCLGSPYDMRPTRHNVFRSEIQTAKSKGLTSLGLIQDLDLFRAKIEEWNQANPDHPVDFHIYGRGQPHLLAWAGAD